MALTQPQRGKILAAIVVVVVVGGMAWSQLTDRAIDGKADDLHADLVEAYRDATVEDAPQLWLHEHGDFYERAGHDPDAVAQVDEGIRARYRVEAWGDHRCVVVTWTEGGADISEPEACRP